MTTSSWLTWLTCHSLIGIVNVTVTGGGGGGGGGFWRRGFGSISSLRRRTVTSGTNSASYE